MTTKNNILQFLLTAFIAAAGLLTACSSDDDNGVGGDLQSPTENPIRIVVEVSEHPMVDATAQARESDTRAVATTTGTLDDFTMNGVYAYHSTYYSPPYTVTKTTSWTITPDTWPKDLDNSFIQNPDFYAYTGGTFNLNSGNPYVRFNIAQDASNQHDLLVAKKSATYDVNKGVGKVDLTFDHACAAVAFRVYLSNTLKKQLNGKLTVNSIVLRNIYNDGKYYFNSGWAEVGYSTNNNNPVKTYYTLTNGDIQVGNVDEAQNVDESQNLSSNDIFVIPQTRAANGTEGVYLEVNYTFSGQTQTQATIPLAISWEAGKRYPYDIKLGTNLIK